MMMGFADAQDCALQIRVVRKNNSKRTWMAQEHCIEQTDTTHVLYLDICDDTIEWVFLSPGQGFGHAVGKVRSPITRKIRGTIADLLPKRLVFPNEKHASHKNSNRRTIGAAFHRTLDAICKTENRPSSCFLPAWRRSAGQHFTRDKVQLRKQAWL